MDPQRNPDRLVKRFMNQNYFHSKTKALAALLDWAQMCTDGTKAMVGSRPTGILVCIKALARNGTVVMIILIAMHQQF